MEALPPRGETHDARPAEAPQTDGLSLAEASARYRVSTSTLRRLLREGRLGGAMKVLGPKGSEWRIPAGSLEALGYTASQPAAAPQGERLDLAALERSLAYLTDLVADGQKRLMAAEEDRNRSEREREEVRVEAARLQAQLEAEREKVTDLEGRLAAATARRGIFRRRPKP